MKDPVTGEEIPDPAAAPVPLMTQAAEQMARDNAAPQMPAAALTPATGAAPQMEPTLNTFDESKGVAGRVNSIIGEDSPLMAQAATKGTQTAAARGLTNSSLAAEASQNAVLSAATPIATADASLYQQAQLANQSASNNASQTNAQLELQMKQLNTQKEQFAASLGLSVQDLDLKRDQLTQQQQQFLDTLNANQSNFQAELSQRGQQFTATQAQQTALANLDATTKTNLAQIEAQFKLGIQNNTNISQAWGTMMGNIAQIQNNKDLNSSTKTTLINNTLSSFAAYAQFWTKASGPDAPPVDDLLNFGPPPTTGDNGGTPPTSQPPGTQTPVPAPGSVQNGNLIITPPPGNDFSGNQYGG